MIRQFFVDDVGAFSCMRLLTFAVTVAVLAVWVYGNLRAGAYVPLGPSEAGVIAAAVGGKAVQARFEYGGPRLPGVNP